MTIKVAYNDCYGGFELSQTVLNRMYSLGSEYVSRVKNDTVDIYRFNLDYSIPRHDKILLDCIREYGPQVNTYMSEIKVKTIEGNRYIIQEYDGLETVLEPKDIEWIEVV